jgi:hypothetical protein
MAATRYFDLVREMKNAYNHRLRLVESAQQRGIKPTARLFATTAPPSASGCAATSSSVHGGWPNGPALGIANLTRLPLTAKRNCSNSVKRCLPLAPAA